MKNKTLLTLCAAPLLLSVNAMAVVKGAFTLEDNQVVTIDENYTGGYAFDNWTVGDRYDLYGEMCTIKFDRQFQANIPATIVSPITVSTYKDKGASSNADFYTLQYVIPDFRNGNRTWLAKMKKIDVNHLVEHSAYAVIVHENGPITINIKDDGGQITAPEPDIGLIIRRQFNEVYSTIGNGNELGLNYTFGDYNDEYGNWYFIGNYNNGTYKSGDPEVGLCYGFEGSNDGDVPKGSFGKIVDGTEKKAFRGLLCKAGDYVQLPAASYIKQNGGAAKSANVFSIPETINVEFVDTDANGVEHTTYVGKLNRIDNVRLNRERSTFDLKGRNVDGKRTAKGVYLKK